MNNDDLLNKILSLESELDINKVEIENVKKDAESIKKILGDQIKYSEYIAEMLDKSTTIIDVLIEILNLKDIDDSNLKFHKMLDDKDKEYFNQLIKKNLRKRKIDDLLSDN